MMPPTAKPSRYRPYPVHSLVDRTWPDRQLTQAPLWCSVDLRDGNQALLEPMGLERKLKLFEQLVSIGFREIEVGFPAASQTDFDFVRQLIDEDRVPDHVTLQVLTQAREPLIERTLESLRGARRAIVHLYNSTSTLQRRVVFGMDRAAVLQLAVRGTRWVKQAAEQLTGTEIRLEYSPESFTGTELEFARDVCNAVTSEWGIRPGAPTIINLPATVEMSMPNVYADQIEWMSRHLSDREQLLLSVHTHNDRGCAVAAAELALLAGADRVEGTLFGNGERTGNADLVTLALNLYTHGIDPQLDLHDVPALVETFEQCNRLPVPPRHPYAGKLVFTAFSGSHQDAIRKGLQALTETGSDTWEVPYLPIDPSDVGRHYEPLIRINSQSGKGGVAFVLERAHGYRLPRALAAEFSAVVQRRVEQSGEEMGTDALGQIFEAEYLAPRPGLSLEHYEVARREGEDCTVAAQVTDSERAHSIEGRGSGPIEAFVQALRPLHALRLRLVDYDEHALGEGEAAHAVAYVTLQSPTGQLSHGVGRHQDIVTASLLAVVSGLNRLGVAPAEPAEPLPPRRSTS